MSNYFDFKQRIRFVYSDNDRNIDLSTDVVTASEVTENFISFMLAVGFAKESIIDSMAEVVHIHDLDSMAEEYENEDDHVAVKGEE